MTQNGLWNVAKKRMLEDRGALPKADGDVLREHQAMHEENFLSSWLKEDAENKGRKENESSGGNRRGDEEEKENKQ